MGKEQFISAFAEAVATSTFIKCTLSRPGTAAAEGLKNLYLRPVEIKKQLKIAVTYRYKTRDEVKNYTPEQLSQQLEEWLGTAFLNADLFTRSNDFTLSFDKKGTAHLQVKMAARQEAPELAHNRSKNRLLDPARPWLHQLGITNNKGEVLPTAQDKWRQINKFLEIIDSLLREQPLPNDAHIADMGSGKGYLTFALYDFLTRHYGMQPQVVGVELRQDLVDFCNAAAEQSAFSGLKFVALDINDHASDRLDLLIALHACDTATDLALSKGILAQASVIIVAPCCHKQIRREMQSANALSPILRHGILEERQAEILTDGIRSLILESEGYRTKVFEFISTSHTAKNVMITAQKAPIRPQQRQNALDQVQQIKKDFGIRTHFLEHLVG